MPQLGGGSLGSLQYLFSEGTLAGLTDNQLLERFRTCGDEHAFAALVRRHGSMVLGLCRSVTRDECDAEDAFQSTFLMLARKAGSLWVQDSLGGWLHRVALRIAVETSKRKARQRKLDQAGAIPEAVCPDAREDLDERLAALHEEIDRLPAKYRAPIVLCELQELTREQVAGQLGWPPGTVAGRLARARSLLRDRLARRGLVGATALAAGSWFASGAKAGPTPALTEAVVRTAVSSLGPSTALGGLTALVRGKPVLFSSRLIFAGGLCLSGVLIVVALAAGWQTPKASSAPITGSVVGPEGRPAAGVRVFYSERDAGSFWGKVQAEGRVDAAGRFELAIPRPGALRPDLAWGTLWVYRPGDLIGLMTVSEGTLPQGLPARLSVGPPAICRFEVQDPDGKPVAGAAITPRVLTRHFASVPDGLAELIAAETRTDEHGRAVLKAFFPEEVSTVIVSASGFGSQQFGFGHHEIKSDTKILKLLPTGSVRGRVTGPSQYVTGRRLVVSTWRPTPSLAAALASVTTDEVGRFEVREIAAGKLNVDDEPDITCPIYVRAFKELKVEAGKTTEIEIPLSKAVRLKGAVKEKGTGKPVPGVEIAAGHGVGPSVTSDSEGRITGFTRPGQVSLSLVRLPATYASLMYGLPWAKVSEGAAEFTFPPIEINRAGIVRGLVVDPKGKPVAGAEVEASWQVDEGPGRRGRREISVRSGPDGTFRVRNVMVGAPVELSAHRAGLRTAQAQTSRADSPDPAVLRLAETPTVVMTGRVLKAGGLPLAGAQVHIRVQKRYPSGQVKGDELVELEQSPALITDAAGLYKTPRQLASDGEYAAFVTAEGYEPDRTEWTPAGSRSFDVMILRPEAGTQSLEGTIRDRAGRPIADVSIWSSEGSSSPVKTDDAGKFHLSGLRGRGFLFARQVGYRFAGRIIEPGVSSVALVLSLSAELPARRLQTVRSPLPRTDEIKLTLELLKPRMSRILKEGDLRSRNALLKSLAAVDPAQALETIEKGGFADPDGFLGNVVRSQAALSLLHEDGDEAAAVIQTIADPLRRVQALMDVADVVPAGDRDGKLRWIDRALLDAHSIKEPANRVLALATVAEHLLDLGKNERATEILRRNVATARELPTEGWGGYARGRFAEELSQIDPDTALELAKDLRRMEKSFPERHLLNIAQKLASRDPARAERIVNDLKPSFALSRALPRICHAMAVQDLVRARRILDRVDEPADPFARSYTLGMMALALTTTDKTTAERLLREAFDDLARYGREGRIGLNSQDAATVGAALLPVAERISPALVDELLWHALSFRNTRGSDESASRRASFDSSLALLVARYNRDAARVLYEPVAERFGLLMTQEFNARPTVWAGAAIDPAATARMVEALPDDPKLKADPFHPSKNEALVELAAWLAAPPEQRWDRALGDILHLWVPVGEDIY